MSSLDKMGATGQNTGHGHVYKRPDGMVARCGGPGMCAKCALDATRKAHEEQGLLATTGSQETLSYAATGQGELVIQCSGGGVAEKFPAGLPAGEVVRRLRKMAATLELMLAERAAK